MPETKTKQAWEDVSAGATDLGGKLKTHFAQVRDEDATEAKEALRKLADAVGDAFEAVGNAARDPEVRTEARKVAGTLGEALGATFAGLGDEMRKVFNRKGEPGDGETAAGDASATDGSTWAPPTTPPAPPADGTDTTR
jgi:hypothetical protein